MALNKVNYIDGQTLITAKNMNEIQDEVIRLTELIEVPSSGVVKTVNGVEPDENGNVEVEVSEDVVLYTAQTLTEQQKTQVCTNIGAQKTLNFDTTPISGSTNPVTSGGLFSKFATQDENIEMTSMAASIAMPGSLKWDGHIGDRECVIVEAEEPSEGILIRMQFVHVSDYVPEIFSLMMGEVPAEDRILTALCSMGGLIAGAIPQVTEISAQVADDMFIMGDEAFVYVPTDGYLAEGIMFPKKGWYFMSVNAYLPGIEIPVMCVNGLKIEGLNFPDNSGGDADKYFEKITTVSDVTKYVGDTITWDGNIDGRVYNEISQTQDGLTATMKFVKMSDSIPTEEDFKNGCSVSMNGSFGGELESETEELTYDNMVAEGLFLEDGFIQAGYVFIVPYDNYTLSEPESNIFCVFPEAGTYFFNIDATVIGLYMRTTSFTIPGYNFSTATYKTTEVIKTEHLPEHLRFGKIDNSRTYTWDGNTTGHEEHSSLNSLFKISSDTFTLDEISKSFELTVSQIDVTTGSILQSQTIINGMEGIVIIEDEYGVGVWISGTDDSGNIIPVIPIILSDNTGIYSIYMPSNSTATCVSSLKIGNNTIKTIDPKYLPDGYGGGSGGGTGLPTVSTSDNNKTVKVVNGEWKVTKLSYTDLTNTPSLSKVATSGSYTDLKNTPIPTASSSDEGAFLRIVNGQWTIAHLPTIEEGEF